MSKLSDTQAIILSAASQRPDGNLLPLPGSLRGGAAAKVVGALLARGLAREQPAEADAGQNALWRTDADGCGLLLLITDTGRSALGIEVGSAPEAAAAGEAVIPAKRGRRRAVKAAERPAAPPARKAGETKQAALIRLLGRTEGVTVAEAVVALGWQPHTVRGAFAGALKKRLGLTIVSEKVEGRGRVYRIAD